MEKQVPIFIVFCYSFVNSCELNISTVRAKRIRMCYRRHMPHTSCVLFTCWAVYVIIDDAIMIKNDSDRDIPKR